MEPVRVDLAGRDRPHRHLRATRQDGTEQPLPPGRCELLGVVQQRERPDAMVAEPLVVEQHAGDDERPCERTAARFVGAGDEPRA